MSAQVLISTSTFFPWCWKLNTNNRELRASGHIQRTSQRRKLKDEGEIQKILDQVLEII